MASQDGREDSLIIHQDVNIYAAILNAQESLTHILNPDRHAWIQVVTGSLSINNIDLHQGDGASVSKEELLLIKVQQSSEVLLFDLT